MEASPYLRKSFSGMMSVLGAMNHNFLSISLFYAGCGYENVDII